MLLLRVGVQLQGWRAEVPKGCRTVCSRYHGDGRGCGVLHPAAEQLDLPWSEYNRQKGDFYLAGPDLSRGRWT